MFPAVDLLSACPFAILAGTTITDVPPSVITGDVGLSPATGAGILVSCAEVTGTIYSVDAAGPLPCRVINPALLGQAKADLVTAYNQGLGLAPTMPIDTPINGVLTAGVYPYTAAALTGAAVTFSGSGDFVFQIPTTLTVPVGAVFTLAAGADARRIFFIVGSSATINSGVTFKGNVLALTSISAGTLSNIEGKLLARNGAVTLDQNTVSSNSCFSCPIITLAAIPTTGTLTVPYVGSAVASPAAVYAYTVTAGALPNGLALDPVTGAITGIPTVAGVFNFTIEAEDISACVGSRAYTVTISPASCPVITIDPPRLFDGIFYGSFSTLLTASGGVPPYTFTVTAGTLPTGVELSSGGILSGRTTEIGTFEFTIQATDANFCLATISYTVIIYNQGRSNCVCGVWYNY